MVVKRGFVPSAKNPKISAIIRRGSKTSSSIFLFSRRLQLKLSAAFKKVTFTKVFKVLVAYQEDAEKNKAGYEKAFNTLQKMKISNKKEVDFEILLEKNKYRQEAGKDNFHVYGKNKLDKIA